MRTVIRKMGNSHGVFIPKSLLAAIGVKANDKVDMTIENGKIVIVPFGHDPRAGWAEESKALAEVGEDGLVWSEFPNKDDDKLVW